MIKCAGSWKAGVWWLRIKGYGLVLKASWNEPLFSERYKYRRFMPLGFGWRVGWLTPSTPSMIIRETQSRWPFQ